MEQDKALLARVNQLRGKYAARDAVAQQVRWVKNGDFDKVAPGIFNESYPRSITANLIDVYSKHAAAALSPLPSIRCRAASMGASDRAKKRADKRTQIVNHYFEYSRVQEQMQSGADNFIRMV